VIGTEEEGRGRVGQNDRTVPIDPVGEKARGKRNKDVTGRGESKEKRGAKNWLNFSSVLNTNQHPESATYTP